MAVGCTATNAIRLLGIYAIQLTRTFNLILFVNVEIQVHLDYVIKQTKNQKNLI